MFARLRAALRPRPAPPTRPPSKATPVGELSVDIVADPSEFIDRLSVSLPVRVPADEIARARRQAWIAQGHILAAVRAQDRWHSAATAEAARVYEVASHHHLDAAEVALGQARDLLPHPATKEGLR
ncbi:hypothetical protein ACFXKD_27645 [Nocardiopsis aegyptia]|uniref:hypothetical protein n=1 Tax=Nocardiopsis aegyptia TaxID=220378 RepID=UPI003673420A